MNIQEGDKVILKEKPNGYASKHYALTKGNTYICLGFMGSNIVTTTDVPGDSASYHWERVELAT